MADSFSPPEQVRKNAARSLELRQKHHRGMTAVGVARARDLSNGKHISAGTIKRMHSYFARHEVDKKGKDWANQSNPSAGYIAWLGWGGDAGRSWVNGIMRKLNAKESVEAVENMSSTKAATVRGIFLRPGVSKNRRLYTKENIGKAVERMQEALKGNSGLPINMATSHGAAFNDDALSTVGRVTSVYQLPDGSAGFEADIANTSHGRDVANLAVGGFIKGVSIRGQWLGDVNTVTHDDGQEAVTADDLGINGIDFTHSPGVEGAEIVGANLAESASADASFIFESVAEVQIVESVRDEQIIASAVENAVQSALEEIFEKDAAKPYGDVTYADPGYQADKKKRYPIDNAKHVRAAWSYINQADNGKLYSAAQLKRIKARIKSAAKKFGINIVEEQEMLASEIMDALEAYASISLNNDDDSINITGYATDPHQLKVVANRIAFGAIAAMHAIDPDDDGDIYLSKPDWSHVDDTGDAGGMGSEDEEMVSRQDSMTKECSECGGLAPESSVYCHECGAMLPESIDDNNMEDACCGECGVPAMEGAVHCHMCGAQLPESVVKNSVGCTTCGEMAPEDAMYCPSCGDPVPQAESDKTDYEKIIPNQKGEPADKDLYAKVIAAAKEKFDVYPSAVANAWVSQEYKKRGGTYTTKSAESQDEALTQTEEEVTVSDNHNTAEANAEESGLEVPAARTLSDADLSTLAAMIVAASKPTENTPDEDAAEVAPEAEADADAEEAPEADAEESNNSKENEVSENFFTAEQVAEMVTKAATEAAKAAVEAAKADAVESYRSGNATRKGLVNESAGFDAKELLESDAIDPRALSEMNSTEFRTVQSEIWGSTPFFAAKFAQADRGF